MDVIILAFIILVVGILLVDEKVWLTVHRSVRKTVKNLVEKIKS